MIKSTWKMLKIYKSALPDLLLYQVFTKALILLILLPLFRGGTGVLIRQTGKEAVTGSTLGGFLMTPQGIIFLLTGGIFFLLVVFLELSGPVLISRNYLLYGGHRVDGAGKGSLRRLGKVIKEVAVQFRLLLHPRGLLLVPYFGLVVPLTGVGISSSVSEGVKIPNFILSVILETPKYLIPFVVLIAFLVFLGIRWLFIIHGMLLNEQSIKHAMSSSTKKVRHNIRSVVFGFLKGFVINALIIGLLSMSMFLLAGESYTLFSEHLLTARTIMLFFFLVFLALLFLATILFVPFEIFLLTELYYRLEEPAAFERKKMESLVIIRKFNRRGKAKKPRRLAKSFLVVIFLTGTVSVSLVSAYFFDDIFRPQQDIQIVAHRGGGNLAPENSLEGILVAADHGAKWSEIDVQRTKDGEYVINHDNSFTRVAGVPMSPQDMTLEEIRQIRIKNAFSRGSATAPVPTLREVLPASKGKIGLFLELKGKTADRQMADDVIAMVKEFDMTEECVITTLDQNMAKYVKEKHPDIKVAYLYYFSLGKPERLPGDYLVMEEGQAMNFRILLARIEGKKTGIWTVNTEEAVQQAINKDVDILITDDVDMTRKVIKDRDKMSDFQLVILRVT